MSDDLVKLLRRPYGSLTGGERQAVADRIEELEAKVRESALSELSALGQASEAYIAQKEAEAKLEKSLDALDHYRSCIEAGLVPTSRYAHDAIATIKGTQE